MKKGNTNTDWNNIIKGHNNIDKPLIEIDKSRRNDLFIFVIPVNQSSSVERIVDLSWMKEKLGNKVARQFVEIIRNAIMHRGWNSNKIHAVITQEVNLIHDYFVQIKLKNILEIDFEQLEHFHAWLDAKYNGTSTCSTYAMFLRTLLLSIPEKDMKYASVDIKNGYYPPGYYLWNQNSNGC